MTSPRSDSAPLLIVGSGGHAREVYGILHDLELPCIGLADDRAPDLPTLGRIGATYVGTVAKALGSVDQYSYIIGIGSGEVRRRMDGLMCTRPVSRPLIHPAASVGLDVQMEAGSIIFSHATVTTNIHIGKHAHIGRGAAVGHDSVIGDFATVMPLASVSGSVTVGDRATIGSGAVVRQGQTIGAGAFVGAGAVVVRDVAAGEVVVGNPAAPLRR